MNIPLDLWMLERIVYYIFMYIYTYTKMDFWTLARAEYGGSEEATSDKVVQEVRAEIHSARVGKEIHLGSRLNVRSRNDKD